MQSHKRCAKTGAKRCLRLNDPLFGAGYLGGVAGEEVVHCLLRREFGDGWHNTEGVSGEKDNIGRMASHTGADAVRNTGDGICGARVFGERIVVQINAAAAGINSYVFQNGAKSTRGLIDLRFGFC